MKEGKKEKERPSPNTEGYMCPKKKKIRKKTKPLLS